MDEKLPGFVRNAIPSRTEFTVCFVRSAASDEREVDRIDAEVVRSRNTGNGICHLGERNIHGAAADLTHEMVVIGCVLEVDDGRPMSEMNMLHMTGRLERIDGAIDGRLVDLLS